MDQGRNIIELLFEHIEPQRVPDIVHHLETACRRRPSGPEHKGYHMADVKPEHVILDEDDCERIEQAGGSGDAMRREAGGHGPPSAECREILGHRL